MQTLFTVLAVFIMLLSGSLLAKTTVTEKKVTHAQMAEQPTKDETQNLKLIQEKIQLKIPNINIESINPSQMPGFYEVLSSGQLLYISEDSNYLITGKLYSIDQGIKNLTAKSMDRIDMLKAPMRRDKVAAVSKDDMIIFNAAKEKYRVTVFTDVDCSFCRKLHKEMDNYNDLGITIEYMGFPRAGIGSPSHKKLQSVWCAEDPLEAMNKAKNDRVFGNDTCDDPLTDHFKLVSEFGLNGTPALILKSGRLIAGFATASQLLELLKEDELALANTVTAAAE